MNSFGTLFRVQIYGESHGVGVGIIVDGVPAGIPLKTKDFYEDLGRRKPSATGTTKRIEEDEPIFLSGIFNDFTTGAPINIFFKNKNIDSAVYSDFSIHPRPGHADFTSANKYGCFNDLRGGGHFSGRLTLGVVAAGVIAKKILSCFGAAFETVISSIGTLKSEDFSDKLDSYLLEIEKKGDSLGGTISLCVKNLPIGLGEPFFESVESKISSIVFSIPGIKGIEFGAGFEGTKLFGSEFNDRIISIDGKTDTNYSGGINGGITNGNEVFLKVAVRPTSSIFKTQDSFNFEKNAVLPLTITGRHDVAFILRVPVVLENSVAIALADLYLQSKKYCFKEI